MFRLYKNIGAHLDHRLVEIAEIKKEIIFKNNEFEKSNHQLVKKRINIKISQKVQNAN